MARPKRKSEETNNINNNAQNENNTNKRSKGNKNDKQLMPANHPALKPPTASYFSNAAHDIIKTIVGFLDDKSAISLAMTSKLFNKLVTDKSNLPSVHQIIHRKIEQQNLSLEPELNSYSVKQKLLLKLALDINKLGNNNKLKWEQVEAITKQIGQKQLLQLIKKVMHSTEKAVIGNAISDLKKIFENQKPEVMHLLCINFKALGRGENDAFELIYRMTMRLGYLIASAGSLDALSVYYSGSLFSNQTAQKKFNQIPIVSAMNDIAHEYMINWCLNKLPKSIIAFDSNPNIKMANTKKTEKNLSSAEKCAQFMLKFLSNSRKNNLYTKMPLKLYQEPLDTALANSVDNDHYSVNTVLESPEIAKTIDTYQKIFGKRGLMVKIREYFPSIRIDHLIGINKPIASISPATNNTTYIDRLREPSYLFVLFHVLNKQYGEKLSVMTSSELSDLLIDTINNLDESIYSLSHQFNFADSAKILMAKVISMFDIKNLTVEDFNQIGEFHKKNCKKWLSDFMSVLVESTNRRQLPYPYYDFLIKMVEHLQWQMTNRTKEEGEILIINKLLTKFTNTDLSKLVNILSNFEQNYPDQYRRIFSYFRSVHTELPGVNELIEKLVKHQDDLPNTAGKLVDFYEKYVKNPAPAPAVLPRSTAPVSSMPAIPAQFGSYPFSLGSILAQANQLPNIPSQPPMPAVPPSSSVNVVNNPYNYPSLQPINMQVTNNTTNYNTFNLVTFNNQQMNGLWANPLSSMEEDEFNPFNSNSNDPFNTDPFAYNGVFQDDPFDTSRFFDLPENEDSEEEENSADEAQNNNNNNNWEYQK